MTSRFSITRLSVAVQLDFITIDLNIFPVVRCFKIMNRTSHAQSTPLQNEN